MTRVRTMEEVAAEATERPRFRAALVSVFAALALVLAAVGIFGVLSFSVRERMREFGVRLALGATSGDILRLVLGAGVQIAGTGAVIGVAAAALLARTLASLLFGVTPLDPRDICRRAGAPGRHRARRLRRPGAPCRAGRSRGHAAPGMRRLFHVDVVSEALADV